MTYKKTDIARAIADRNKAIAELKELKSIADYLNAQHQVIIERMVDINVSVRCIDRFLNRQGAELN